MELNKEINQRDTYKYYIADNRPFDFIFDILQYKEVVRFHGEIFEYLNKGYRQYLFLLPRFHFKSSLITIGYTIFQIIKNPDIRVCINSKTLKQAKQILSEIKGHFKKNEILKYCFGDYIGDVWREDSIIVKKRKRIIKEPTIAVGAVDHELTGGHYDLIINDDLAGLTDMVSEVYREATLRFYKVSKYLSDKGTVEINIGTRWHVMDVYSFMINRIPAENIMTRKAILEDGSILFKERFTLEDLTQIKDDDPILFEAQMQNNPTAIGDMLFPLEKLKFFDINSFSGNYIMGYVDPAFGKYETKEPCYFSFIIGSLVGDKIYIIDWLTNRLQPKENEILIIEKVKQYGIRRLGVESNAQQSEFIRNVEKAIDVENKSIIDVTKKVVLGIEYINHTVNKDRRIQGMHGTVVKNVLFREDWQEVYNESMKQVILYPHHKFKDAPDALEGLLGMTKFDFGSLANDTMRTGKRDKDAK